MGKLAPCKTCGAEIATNAKVCPNCGAKVKRSHRGLLGFLAVILILGAIGTIIEKNDPSPNEAAKIADAGNQQSPEIETSETESSDEKSLDDTIVTKEEFDAVESGMTYEEVVEIIGFEGELNSQADIGMGSKYITEIYSWSNLFGSNMNVTFQGGKVISKAQFGLF